MIEWTRATKDERCGYCGARVPYGEPIQAIQIQTMKRRLLRGQCCAGEAPPDLPALIERAEPEPIPMTRLRAVAQDFRMKAAG